MPKLKLLLTALALTTAALTIPTTQAQAAITETVLFNKGDAGYGCYRIPAIVKTMAGTLLAFAEARRAGCADSQEIHLVLRRSEDDGRTWAATPTLLSRTHH